VPSRERVGDYQELRSRVEQLIGQINGEFGELGRTPIHYLHRSFSTEELVALYRAADVMLVTPLRDGMNLVAKEYVATRLENTGTLVLSEFTGAAHELSAALLVNPHDIDGMAAILYQALTLEAGQQRERMRALRRTIAEHDVYEWAREFFEALAA
jgi:trehalose-6-phosphate synthase